MRRIARRRGSPKLSDTQTRAAQRARYFLVLGAAVWLHAGAALLTATTLPRATLDLGGHTLLAWGVTAYLLASVVAGAAAPGMVARHGVRNTLLGGAGLFGVGCCVSALAADMPAMLAGRIVQGLGAGALLAVAYGALRRFPSGRRATLAAAVATAWNLAALCGPLIGAGFTAGGSWRNAFWAFAVQALALAFAVHGLGPSAHRRPATVAVSRPLARLGALVAAVVLVGTAGTGVGWFVTLVSIAGAALAGWLFLALDDRAAERLFCARLRGPPDPAAAHLLLMLAAAATGAAFPVYGALLLDLLNAHSPLAAAYVLGLQASAWPAAAALARGLPWVDDVRRVRTGAVLIALGVTGFAIAAPHGEPGLLYPWAICLGGGLGLAGAGLVERVAAATACSEQRAALAATGIQQVGLAIGAAICGIVANGIGFAQGVSIHTAERVAWWVFAAFVPIAVLANLLAWWRPNLDP